MVQQPKQLASPSPVQPAAAIVDCAALPLQLQQLAFAFPVQPAAAIANYAA